MAAKLALSQDQCDAFTVRDTCITLSRLLDFELRELASHLIDDDGSAPPSTAAQSQEEETWSYEETGKYLGVSKPTVSRLVKAKKIRVLKKGGGCVASSVRDYDTTA